METTLTYRLEGKVPVVGLGANGGWITLGEFETTRDAKAKADEPQYESFRGFRMIISWDKNEVTTIEQTTWGKK